MTFELLKIGKHIRDVGTEELDWKEFKYFIECLPPVPDNAVFRAMRPNSYNWSLNTTFLSLMLYALQGANWQRAGGDEDKRPEPIIKPREDWESDSQPDRDDGETFGLQDIRGELAARRERLADS
ncbi:hypothetical protein [Nocardia terpenica]|uniref:Uncharacterized protein n=1 Tax=Nocardia terpenica TaxID=455432 RepID=A0A291RTW9_9NOCA|nr:hypothetical protein [Nocardia terpenica]ATL70785.1 hypothetical protein CRH09_35985 [Nocardia terpenica]